MRGNDASSMPTLIETRSSPGVVKAFMVAALVAALAWCFYPTVSALVSAVSMNVYGVDATQHVAPLLSYAYPESFEGDYVTQYYLEILPAAYKYLYEAGSSLADPREMSKVVALSLLAFMMMFCCIASWRLAGVFAALGTAALCLSSGLYLWWGGGGVPRAFGFVFVAAAIWALIANRPWGLAAATVLAAAFYPPVAALCGTALALFLFVPAQFGGLDNSWSLAKRLSVLTATGVLTVGIALPNVAPHLVMEDSYGSSIDSRDAEDIAAYPERLGRHPHVEAYRGYRGVSLGMAVRYPVEFAYRAVVSSHINPIIDEIAVTSHWSQVGVLAVICILLVFGYIVMLRETLMARRMALLGVACVAIYILSFLLYPYLYYPSRYPLFSVPLFIAVALPAALSAIPRGVPRLRSRPKLLSYLSPACLVIGLTVTMLLVGGRGPDVDYAFQRQISGKEEKAYEFLGSLSGRVLVAGWPDRIDSVVLGSAKPALLTKKSHIIFHTGYADELRRRTYALIDAYFATDVEPLRELAGTFGVTHLIVHREHYEPERRPTYFPPFDEPAKAAATRLGGPEDAETLRQRQAIVYDADGVVILDLRRLAERQE